MHHEIDGLGYQVVDAGISQIPSKNRRRCSAGVNEEA
jgi:hypothetical protein